MGALIPLLAIAAGGWATWWLLTLWSRQRDRRIAARRGMLDELSGLGITLEWDEDNAKFHGSAHGQSIEYQFVATGQVEGVASYITRVHLDKPFAIQLDLRRRRALTRVDSTVAAATGDPSFDRVYGVQTNQPDVATRLLDSETRQWLVRFQADVFHVDDRGVSLERAGRVDDDAEVRRMLLEFLRVSERLALVTQPRGYRESFSTNGQETPDAESESARSSGQGDPS